MTCRTCNQQNGAIRSHCQHCRAVLPETARVIGSVAHNVKERCPQCQAWHDQSDMYCVQCGHRLRHTSFAPRRDKSQGTEEGRPQSSLPGSLGAAVNELLVCEVEGNAGEGFTCTQKRLIVSKAAISAGGLQARKAYSFPFG